MILKFIHSVSLLSGSGFLEHLVTALKYDLALRPTL